MAIHYARNACAGKTRLSRAREMRFSGFHSDKIAAAAFNGQIYRKALLSNAMRVRLFCRFRIRVLTLAV
jgi:hypothetical protein